MCDDSQKGPSEEGLKQLPLGNADNAVNHRDDGLQGFPSGSVWKAFNAAKAYLESHLLLICIFERVGVGSGEGNLYLSIFQNRRVFNRRGRWCGVGIEDAWEKFDPSGGGPYDNQQSVFVSIAKGLQQNKRLVPSLVWLKALNEAPSLRLRLPHILQEVFLELGPAGGNRKLDSAAGVFLPIQMPNQVVERGSGILNNVASDSAEGNRRVFADLQSDIKRSIRIFIDGAAEAWDRIGRGDAYPP